MGGIQMEEAGEEREGGRQGSRTLYNV